MFEEKAYLSKHGGFLRSVLVAISQSHPIFSFPDSSILHFTFFHLMDFEFYDIEFPFYLSSLGFNEPLIIQMRASRSEFHKTLCI